MTEGGEPIVELGTQDAQGAFTGEFEFDYATDTGDALLRHVDSGAELRWSVANSRWELNQPLDLGSNDLTNVGAMDVDDLSTNGQNGLQSLQDVTSSRSLGTQETNSTGNPILVSTNLFVGGGNVSSGDDVRVRGQVDGDVADVDTVSGASGDEALQVAIVLLVPNNSTYTVEIITDDTANLSIGSWFEQRVGI